MKLVGFVPPTPHPRWTLCPQMGVTDVVVKIHPDLTGLPARRSPASRLPRSS